MRRKLFMLITMTISSITAISALFTSGVFAKSNKAFADNMSYGITFNSSKNKFHSYTDDVGYDGEATIQTNLGNDIKFSYYQFKGTNSTWHVLGNGGYFYNIDPIHGIENISFSFKTDSANYSIYYSGDDAFDQHQSFVSSSSEITSFDFNGYNPNYFKVVNESETGLNISEINITLSCEDIHPELNGVTPMISEDKKTITYGLYPQKNVNDSSLISNLNDLTAPESNGWYYYQDEYYAKVSAKPYNSSYKFDNGNTIVSGTTYWFKCEPITWNILSNNNGEYYLLSSVLLDAHRYNENYSGTKDGHYANNYVYSEIRAWLNNDFYSSAFALGNEYIQTTVVDNSASTTNTTSNSYASPKYTNDKVFLPSYKDYISSGYGFSYLTSKSSTRYCKTTDWARARGAGYSTSSSYLYNGYYLTRSPYSGSSYNVWSVSYSGALYSDGVGYTYLSVRPGLSIKIV